MKSNYIYQLTSINENYISLTIKMSQYQKNAANK